MTDSEKLDLLISEMQGMKQEMTGMKQEMTGVKQEMTEMKQDLTGVKQDVSGMKQELADVKQDVSEMKQELADVKQKVTKTELILENEIRVNIQRVAEGHLDLSRNLHDAMRPGNEVEMLAIKVRMLESDVKELKAKIS